MKKTLIAANWKSNKTKTEAKNWLETVSIEDFSESLEVVLFPPFTLLDVISGYIRVNDLPFKLGAQNISPFDPGPYTGEVNAQQIAEFADYVLVGHSERRANFSENDDMVSRKIEKAIQQSLIPIICISNVNQLQNIKINNKTIIAYEPLDSIGSGNPADPGSVDKLAKEIKANFQNEVIYGGSVSSETVKNYLSLESISGVLVGTDSLEPKSFLEIIKNAI